MLPARGHPPSQFSSLAASETAAEPTLHFGKSDDLFPLPLAACFCPKLTPWAPWWLCSACCSCFQVGARWGESCGLLCWQQSFALLFLSPRPGFRVVLSFFLLFCVRPHAHRLGCSRALLPSERENLRRQFHPQPRLGPWECPHLLLPPWPLPIPGVQTVLEQRTVADPESRPGDKGSLQT